MDKTNKHESIFTEHLFRRFTNTGKFFDTTKLQYDGQFQKCVIFTTSAFEKRKVEASKKICETNGGQIREQDVPLI